MDDKNNLPISIKLPEKFLDEEVRCGYTVSTEVKEIWAVEIDLLVQFDKVCRENGLKYFASCGTALGAVRHHGFIPWDDDVDVMMVRSEYEKLCEIAPGKFRHPYFFQTEETDKGSARGHAQLRNSETTAILAYEADAHLKINQGIFLDIFPLDNVNDNKELFDKQRKIGNRLRRKYVILSNRFHPLNPSFKDRMVACRNTLLSSLFKNRYLKYYYAFDSICRKYNDIKTKYVAMICLGFDNRAFRLRSDFDESVSLTSYFTPS